MYLQLQAYICALCKSHEHYNNSQTHPYTQINERNLQRRHAVVLKTCLYS